jgi:predicted 3-demethylubiquinone-9 3-methyltransferase (glyoxalase superfamily)
MDGAREKIDEVWKKLEVGGTALMPIGEYPFSHRYGWIQDKYGVSWQLMLTNPDGEERPTIVPSFLFVGDVCGRAREALEFYTDTFKESKKGTMVPYGKNPMNEREENLMFSDFKLYDMWFAAMDSGHMHAFGFTEALSLLVQCDSQEEIDAYWSALSAVPKAEQCGWLKDKFGVSWQVNPAELQRIMQSGDKEKIARVTKAFLQMKKFDLAALRKAEQSV